MGEQMEEARELEKNGRLSDAAAIYQKLFKNDPTDQRPIERLLIIYRKLKDYSKELSVLNKGIAALQLREKTVQEKWIQTHPGAASAGKSMLRQLTKDGNGMMGRGDNSLIERWIKRKQLVTSRVSGKKGKGHAHAGRVKKVGVDKNVKKAALAARKTEEREEKKRQRKIDEINRNKIAQERKDRLLNQKTEERLKKAALAARKAEEREEKKARAVRHPSLFVVILQYVAPLEEIDKLMKQHIAYLNKHYANREFLVSGRLIPRTGGLILARAKDRNAVEKMIKQDPFIKRKLASANIIEFSASQVGRGLEEWLK